VQAAKLRLRNSEDQVALAVRQVQVDVRKAMLNFESSIKQLDVSLKSVISATEDRRIAEERYNLGAGILLDLLTANANYTQAVSNKVNAQYDLVLAKQQLKYVVGAEKY
jgi:outer membrane protein